MKTVKILTGVAALSATVWLAFIGLLFLVMTEPQPVSSDTCDLITLHHGEFRCEVVMAEPDEDIRIIRAGDIQGSSPWLQPADGVQK